MKMDLIFIKEFIESQVIALNAMIVELVEEKRLSQFSAGNMLDNLRGRIAAYETVLNKIKELK